MALTAPYMHNGRYKTLQEVVLFYQKGGGAGEGLDLKNLDDKIRRFALTTGRAAGPDRVPGVAHRRVEPPRDSRERAFGPARSAAAPPDGSRRSDGAGRPRAVAPADARPARDAPPAYGRVKPGQSIQAAVDQARPGDTIEVLPGTYKEQVLVDIDDITLRGK